MFTKYKCNNYIKTTMTRSGIYFFDSCPFDVSFETLDFKTKF